MQRLILRFVVMLVLTCTLGIGTPAVAKTVAQEVQVDVVDLGLILQKLPTGARWLQHLREDLLPFWSMETALGKPLGNFPTYRANDGSLVDPKHPPYELSNPDGDLNEIIQLDRDYIRSKSRQIFAYGVAYHLTGDERYLQYAMAGAEYLLEHGLDPDGGVYTYFSGPDAVPGPATLQRTSQDLAYAVSGLGFLYYLTRDEDLLKHIVAIKNYIFDTYYDPALGLLTWVKETSPDGDDPGQKELVSQLDQIYGYMIWLTPTLDGALRAQWEHDLQHLAYSIIKQFYGHTYNLFWGAVTNTTIKNLGTGHTDFGHSVKTMWLIYTIGKLTNNVALMEFGKAHALQLITTAYDIESGTWTIGYKKDPTGKHWVMNYDKEWWALAILDQVTITLSLVEPAYAAMLPTTFAYWFAYMVDHEHHGVWHMIDGVTNKPIKKFPKQHSWKTNFHTFEHTLICYTLSQQLHGLPVSLYYAFRQMPQHTLIQPYLYTGKVQRVEAIGQFHTPHLKQYTPTKVTFTDIR